MGRHFTYLWTRDEFERHRANGSTRFRGAGCNQFRARGVDIGDVLYIISFFNGHLYLLGRFAVEAVCTAAEAPRVANDYEFDFSWATDWVFANTEHSSPKYFDLVVPGEVVRAIRFEGDRAPKFRGEEPDPQTFRGVRPLTQATARRFDELIGTHQPNARGGGYGKSEQNREVEIAAVSFVKEWYGKQGWVVESVERDRCGYDVVCRFASEEEHVEVKGVSGSDQGFTITAGEVRQARDDSRFRLCVVTDALSANRVMHRYSAIEFLDRFSLEPMQYRAALRS
jgi:hypothetical protein